MKSQFKSIRPFIGSKNFTVSRSFYADLGFKENCISENLSYFEKDSMGFYLQDYYLQDWIDNTMVFMETIDVDAFWEALVKLDLPTKYSGVKIVPIRYELWGKECFVHDPSGVLWHFGSFH